jgi:hypothetical protein
MSVGISRSRATDIGGGSVVVGATVVVVVVIGASVVIAAVVLAGSAAAPVQAAAINAIAQTTRVMGEGRTGSDASAGWGLSRKTSPNPDYSAVSNANT